MFSPLCVECCVIFLQSPRSGMDSIVDSCEPNTLQCDNPAHASRAHPRDTDNTERSVAAPDATRNTHPFIHQSTSSRQGCAHTCRHIVMRTYASHCHAHVSGGSLTDDDRSAPNPGCHPTARHTYSRIALQVSRQMSVPGGGRASNRGRYKKGSTRRFFKRGPARLVRALTFWPPWRLP